MEGEPENKEKHINKIISYTEDIFLPIILAVLFVIQNQAFNRWLNLYLKAYSVRLSLVSFALGIILYGPALLFTTRGTNKKRYKYIYLFFISILISLTFSAQFLFYKYSQSFLQFSAIRYIGQTASVKGTIEVLLTPELLLFLANIAIVLIALILALRKNYIEIYLPAWEKIIIILLMSVMVFFGYKYLLDTEKKEWGSTSRLYTDVYDLNAVVGKMGIINFFIEDTFKYVLRSNLTTAADKKFLQTFAKNKPTSQTDGKYFGAEKGKNLIIIQVESLDNAVINQYIGGQEITPNLNQLAKDGLYFNNFYAQVGPGNTADTEFSTLNSLYPLQDDVVFINYAKNQFSALPQLLKKNGYGTYSLHGDVPTFWNRSNIYPGLGYQKAFDLDEFTVTRSVGKGPSDLGDEDLFSQSLIKLENFKQPFMSTVITMSSHTPFILPDDLQTLQIPDNTTLNENQQQYLEAIHYTDKAIGEFIDGLKKDGLYDNSLIFIWGDHGSFTNISSVLGQDLPAQAGKNTLPELTNSNVPMIVLAPEAKLTGITNIPSSDIDIYPTVTNLLGFQTPKTILGQDLFNTTGPVETHSKLVSGGIDAILTSDMAYRATSDGAFSDGSCESWPDQKPLPISNCQTLYKQQSDTIKASNIIIRGNLLNVLLDKGK